MDESTVEADSSQLYTEITLNTAETSESFSAEIYDQQQTVVAKGISKGTKIQLDTSSLPSGTYFLHIFYKAVLQKQIVIE